MATCVGSWISKCLYFPEFAFIRIIRIISQFSNALYIIVISASTVWYRRVAGQLWLWAPLFTRLGMIHSCLEHITFLATPQVMSISVMSRLGHRQVGHATSPAWSTITPISPVSQFKFHYHFIDQNSACVLPWTLICLFLQVKSRFLSS